LCREFVSVNFARSMPFVIDLANFAVWQSVGARSRYVGINDRSIGVVSCEFLNEICRVSKVWIFDRVANSGIEVVVCPVILVVQFCCIRSHCCRHQENQDQRIRRPLHTSWSMFFDMKQPHGQEEYAHFSHSHFYCLTSLSTSVFCFPRVGNNSFL
jgi:hypothetical protein